MNVTEFVTIQTTTDSAEECDQLASWVVGRQLAACVQVSQVKSYYRWAGEVHQDPEFLLSMKTTRAAVPAIKAHLAHQHSYDEPEVIVVPIDDGSRGYLQWMRDSVSV